MVKDYFNAEKLESIFFIAVGVIAILIALWFWFKTKNSFYSGIAYPLVLIAVIQITVGLSVFLRSPKDISRVEEYYARDKNKISEVEIPRMNTVMKNFVIYRYIEIGLIIAGLLLYFIINKDELLKGIGFGLAIQSLLMLVLDLFAEKRGADYLEYLKISLTNIN